MIGCPKPVRRSKVEPFTDEWYRRQRERRSKWKGLKRTAWSPRSTKPIPKVNVRATKRRNLNYRTVIGSDFHRQIRYAAFLRSGGRCECSACTALRAPDSMLVVWGSGSSARAQIREERDRAVTPIPVWFTKGGGEPWRRFRSRDGELHHDSYKFFGDENPAELEVVRWVWKSCHQRIEAERGSARRYQNEQS